MDYRKINSHIILLLVVFIVGVTIAMLIRLIILNKGVDTGTANIIFVIILGICIMAYLVIIATLAHVIVPWIMQKLPERKAILPIEEQIVDLTDAKKHELQGQIIEQSIPTQTIESIRQDSEKRYTEKLSAKINLFLEYSRLAMAPYLTDDELLRLDEYIRCYAGEEPLPTNLTPIKPQKLINLDMGHFGWNMANYFDYKKEDVAPWLKQVFLSLHKYSLSSIVGTLRDSTKNEYNIPIIKDIPKYLREQKS